MWVVFAATSGMVWGITSAVPRIGLNTCFMFVTVIVPQKFCTKKASVGKIGKKSNEEGSIPVVKSINAFE